MSNQIPNVHNLLFYDERKKGLRINKRNDKTHSINQQKVEEDNSVDRFSGIIKKQ